MNGQLREAWTTVQYFDDPRISNSKLNCFRKSRKLYYKTHVIKEWHDEPTAAMRLGSLFDAIAPPNRPDILRPCDTGRRGTKAWNEHFEQYGGDYPCCLVSEFQTLCDMWEAVREHPLAHLLDCQQQPIITWDDDETGLGCRAMLDRLKPGDYIIDIKTTSDGHEDSFQRSAERFHYHRQAAWYQQAGYELTGDILPFLFWTVESVRPHDVRIYELSEQWVVRGEREHRETLRRIAEVTDAKLWRAPVQPDIVRLDEPRYAKYAIESLDA